MSSIYVNEPPTHGKVLIKTSSIGDLELELWPKQAPKACRNFVQLALEGYYNGCRFDRVVPKFIAQCSANEPADQEGFGCVYPEGQFAVETHSRLRFTHRGLVGMAADEEQGTNSTQFFITLAETPDLNGYHSLFGKIVGDTLYNLVRFSELDIDKQTERPLILPRIVSIEVLNNPFDDIVPRRILRASDLISKVDNDNSKSAETFKEKRLRDVKATKGVKNKALLSFYDEFEDADSSSLQIKTKDKSAHALLKNDPKLSGIGKRIETMDLPPAAKKVKVEMFPASMIETQHCAVKEEEEYNIEGEIEKMKQELIQMDSISKRKAKESADSRRQYKTAVEVEKEKFLINSNRAHKVLIGGKSNKKAVDEDETLSRLFGFQDKLRKQKAEKLQSNATPEIEKEWMMHNLKFKDHVDTSDRGARDMDNIDDLFVVDPLNDSK